MNTRQDRDANTADLIATAIDSACRSIAPTWPLDRFIAVNPYWGRRDQPFDAVDRQLTRLVGKGLHMPRSYYKAIWAAGGIRREDLTAALRDQGHPGSEQALIEALAGADSTPAGLPLLCDTLDARRDVSHEPAWRDAITQQVTQFCAAYFDRTQADWHPVRSAGFYASWLNAMRKDRSLGALMHATGLRRRAKSLPENRLALVEWAVTALDLPLTQLPELLQLLLLRINGWAASCAWLRWQARLSGQDDDHLVDLLAIRLAWECLLDDGERGPGSVWQHWQAQWQTPPAAGGQATGAEGALWQRAHEMAWQRKVCLALRERAASGPLDTVRAQAVFCIDVRSEVFRRALETVDPAVQTLGFAGFFGLPIDYAPLGTSATRPQLPGLLAPALHVTETTGLPASDVVITQRRQQALRARATWRPFQRVPSASFTQVETLGLGYLWKLLRRSLLRTGPAPVPEALGLDTEAIGSLCPGLVLPGEDALETGATLAEQILRAMGLTQDFARLVLLVGHGSQTANNPHAGGLDCGACGGQTGEVNARVLAGLLNDPPLRAVLRARAITIPDSTRFVPALHNTTTDEVQLFDPGKVPATHAGDIAGIVASLRAAGERARAERAPALGLSSLVARPATLAKAIQARANDWAQVRPEWGLANNAAFIVAPRSRTRGLDLQGRSFLHDYDHAQDTDGSVLELIMTAPMIVTHWINLQYHASMVDPLRYGAGNKVLHNVVGGGLGVFEGNGGDLRIGLPLQSLHDGTEWRHTPLRLSVFIEAPRAMLDTVIAKHEVVRQLLDNTWLFLFRCDGAAIERYSAGGWRPWRDAATAAQAA